MTLIVGFSSGESGNDALALGARLASASGEPLLVTHVRPGEPAERADRGGATPPAGDQVRVDAQWMASVRAASCAELLEARGQLADGVRRRLRSVASSSAARGLTDLAAASGASGLVIGSAARGAEGSIRLGTTANQLLHVSPVPVFLAPRGIAASSWALRRVTVAYRATPGGRVALDRAIAFAARCRVPLRLLTLVAPAAGDPVPVLASGRVGGREVLVALKEEARATLHEARVRVCAAVPKVVDPHTRIGMGDDAEAALDDAGWSDGDLLVCGSGGLGQAARVFLGDTAMRLINAARVPVLVTPRSDA